MSSTTFLTTTSHPLFSTHTSSSHLWPLMSGANFILINPLTLPPCKVTYHEHPFNHCFSSIFQHSCSYSIHTCCFTYTCLSIVCFTSFLSVHIDVLSTCFYIHAIASFSVFPLNVQSDSFISSLSLTCTLSSPLILTFTSLISPLFLNFLSKQRIFIDIFTPFYTKLFIHFPFTFTNSFIFPFNNLYSVLLFTLISSSTFLCSIFLNDLLFLYIASFISFVHHTLPFL